MSLSYIEANNSQYIYCLLHPKICKFIADDGVLYGTFVHENKKYMADLLSIEAYDHASKEAQHFWNLNKQMLVTEFVASALTSCLVLLEAMFSSMDVEKEYNQVLCLVRSLQDLELDHPLSNGNVPNNLLSCEWNQFGVDYQFAFRDNLIPSKYENVLKEAFSLVFCIMSHAKMTMYSSPKNILKYPPFEEEAEFLNE